MPEHTERIKQVCPTCDGSGWSAVGPTPAGGLCGSCRGTGEVTPERRACIIQSTAEHTEQSAVEAAARVVTEAVRQPHPAIIRDRVIAEAFVAAGWMSPEQVAEHTRKAVDEALAGIEAIHGKTHWCHDAEGQPDVYQPGTDWWPCPTFAAAREARARGGGQP